jgi:spore photoproduct lyase
MADISEVYLAKLSVDEQKFISDTSKKYHLSFQDRKQLIDIAVDLNMWDEVSVSKLELSDLNLKYDGKKLKSEFMKRVKAHHEKLKINPSKYTQNKATSKAPKVKFETISKDNLGFGLCPVASPKTRCCNLLTLDAVESCGYDCSYCSIQSFYNENRIIFDKSLKEKLENITLDKDEFYHIGTGQSSDSLMWGNQNNILDILVEFARKNPNVMLEFKTKSDNISYFLDKDLPPNLLFTWSLNPQMIIDHEEHLTASLDRRLKAAKKIHDKGALVGFHFHPMIEYEGWKEGYGYIFKRLLDDFDPKRVAMVSLGTLTFIKPVIKKIRSRDFKSKILQIPMVGASGKFSYPLKTKKELFSFAYESLKPWHKEVYFYMCMEDHTLWRDVFGYEYPTNESFEMDMKFHYLRKIQRS